MEHESAADSSRLVSLETANKLNTEAVESLTESLNDENPPSEATGGPAKKSTSFFSLTKKTSEKKTDTHVTSGGFIF